MTRRDQIAALLRNEAGKRAASVWRMQRAFDDQQELNEAARLEKRRAKRKEQNATKIQVKKDGIDETIR